MPSILSTARLERLPNFTLPFDFSKYTWTQVALVATPVFVILINTPSLIRSYRTFIEIGPGGLPHNPLGFLIQTTLSLIARTDTRAVPPPYYYIPSPYSSLDQPTNTGPSTTTTSSTTKKIIGPTVVAFYAPLGQTSFLFPLHPQEDNNEDNDNNNGTLPPRSGSRPDVPGLVVPQRQTTEKGGPELVRRMERFLVELAEANGGGGAAAAGSGGGDGGKGQEWALLEMKPSRLEGKRHQALFLRESAVRIPKFMGGVGGEIAHVHPEGSSHVTLSLVDAEEAVAKGWAERHRLSGVRKILPWSYIMVYAPRDDDEFVVWQRLVVAGCRFVSGGRTIEIPSKKVA
ncbi:uncharacterized protein C8A04DRAFT_10563 [Dichotomopilus funicola]|uniref:Luciferase domain-containing protein n=1 Tax=Dichotomopilus funicola TaxID=1934379 RepID=A0AAN6V7M6_9PEZI|nr:hypothetical protein C8A04DRAFT_10563 [Dichotomopilus funicola]